MKTVLLILLSLSALSPAQDTLTLEQAYTLAKQNHPLIKRNGLIEKTRQFSVENASKAGLPQLQVVGQATYQNEVTQLPFSLPNMSIEPLSKDQYKVYADVQQTIYDGGMMSNQKKIANVTAGIEQQKTEVQLDRLEERINQLFFGLLQTEEQIKQAKLTESDIQNGLRKAEAQLRNGVILRSQVDVLKAQLIMLEQKQVELGAVRKNFMDMLSVFIHKNMDAETVIQRPEKIEISHRNNRTELQLFKLQQEALEVQKSLLHSKNSPKLGAFVQGGYGKPGFNMLKNEFDLFYIAGIRLNIPISGYYTQKNDLELLTIQQEEIEVQKENFLFGQELQTLQSDNELSKIQNLIDKDEQLIKLRESILRASLAQLENGVINTNDYLREVHELDRAKNQKIIHEIQYLLSQYNLKAQFNE